jgi:hypothetical protein
MYEPSERVLLKKWGEIGLGEGASRKIKIVGNRIFVGHDENQMAGFDEDRWIDVSFLSK